MCLLGEVWSLEDRVCIRRGVVRRLPALNTMFVGVWGSEGVSWIVDLSHFASGDEGVAFCSCCMGRLGLLEDISNGGFSLEKCSD